MAAPGVTTTNPAGFLNDQRTTGGGRPYVNGNRKEANNFLLDGIDNNQVSDNLTSYQPNLDAIGEVKMITNNASGADSKRLRYCSSLSRTASWTRR